MDGLHWPSFLGLPPQLAFLDGHLQPRQMQAGPGVGVGGVNGTGDGRDSHPLACKLPVSGSDMSAQEGLTHAPRPPTTRSLGAPAKNGHYGRQAKNL